jgi:hypothetical protein
MRLRPYSDAVYVPVFKGSEWWLDRWQARRFAEAAARGEFEQAETATRNAFQPAGTTDLTV